MDVSKNGPNDFERTSNNFDFILDVNGRLFFPGCPVPTGKIIVLKYLRHISLLMIIEVSYQHC